MRMGAATPSSDWFEKLESVMIIKKTGLPKSNIKDMLLDIINDTERSETLGEKYGYSAYEELKSRLNDEAFFNNADDETLEQFNNALSSPSTAAVLKTAVGVIMPQTLKYGTLPFVTTWVLVKLFRQFARYTNTTVVIVKTTKPDIIFYECQVLCYTFSVLY